MKILNYLFGRSRKTDNTTIAVNPQEEPAATNHTDEILRKLFIDEEPPQQEVVEIVKIKSPISEFLNRNYESKGLSDGHNFGTQELLDMIIRKIKSDFIILIDQMIEEKREGIVKLSNQVTAIGNLSPISVKQLQNVIAETQNSISELQKQKDLSVENEGWVDIPTKQTPLLQSKLTPQSCLSFLI